MRRRSASAHGTPVQAARERTGSAACAGSTRLTAACRRSAEVLREASR
ncbi:hypothetical protein G5V59_22050 [Nocardioides sp. W3-2-3]|nr:hypothetical protein [Nocardioides convexus]NHA01570.1 hypothetical protein [Nocardioides convexus]